MFRHPRLGPAESKIRERPPGLINHVLIVLVFWSWVLVIAPPPELHPGASDCAPGLAFAFMAFRANSWICCPQLPCTSAKTGRTAHVLTAQGGTHR